MSVDWESRIAAFWAAADATRPDEQLERMRELVAERPAGDARALYEWASVHDILGREQEAIPLYGAALAAGLDDDHGAQATVQLASSFRNIGDPQAAIETLTSMPPSSVVGAAPQAFLALALHDAGRPVEALQVALRALAVTLPLYGRAISAGADDLASEESPRLGVTPTR